jgi:hypothetical protein
LINGNHLYDHFGKFVLLKTFTDDYFLNSEKPNFQDRSKALETTDVLGSARVVFSHSLMIVRLPSFIKTAFIFHEIALFSVLVFLGLFSSVYGNV